jgi:8-oxo-dGTP pyrophosphatase MutT (NUDIX family)
MADVNRIIRERVGPPLTTWGVEALERRVTRGDLHLDHPETPLDRLTPAAVLVPLVERGDGLRVLLTQRTAHLNAHAGQISFPGGRAEAHDTDPIATALRETEEEIGLRPEEIEIVGCLDNYETGTGYIVVPVVGFVSPGFSLTIDEFEVAEVFEVPLAFLLERANRTVHERRVGDRRRRYYAYDFETRFIWGATAGMLDNLVRRMNGEDPWEG